MIISILKERLNGLLLIFFAGLIVFGLSFNYNSAQSKNENEPSGAPAEEQVLGEMADDTDDSGEIILEENEISSVQDAQEKEQEIETDAVVPDPEDVFYDEIKVHLKKYCGKNFNVKKCQDYLSKAKDARGKGARFKELYKKYHFEKKEEKKSSVSVSASASSVEDKSNLVVNSGAESKSYEIAAPAEISVLDLMDLLQKDGGQNFSYRSSYGFVDKINGTENSGNMSWMLYVCKSGICKLSNVGAMDCKAENWDKIEWKYLDWTTMDWTTW